MARRAERESLSSQSRRGLMAPEAEFDGGSRLDRDVPLGDVRRFLLLRSAQHQGCYAPTGITSKEGQ
jgi:hypothetical protein